tara:strand:- start:26774 stop:27640 length:867 start_codon:yes stop_codon:yes gene_type:complete
MLFEMHEPTGPIGEYCARFIYYQGFQPEHKIERVVPDGCLYLIFELDHQPRNVFDNQSLESIAELRHAWISGAQNEYISISAHEDSEMFVIQFKPGGAARLLPGDVSQFTNRVLSVEAVLGTNLGNATLKLRDSLLQAANPAAKFDHAQTFLAEHTRTQDAADAIVADIVLAIIENSTTQLKNIIGDCGYSQKQIIHHFKTRVGLTPKAFQRIVRFNEILPKIMEQQSVSWNKISIECDYFDQSHFIKEFKNFSGYSPRDFLSEQKHHEATNFFPLIDTEQPVPIDRG